RLPYGVVLLGNLHQVVAILDEVDDRRLGHGQPAFNFAHVTSPVTISSPDMVVVGASMLTDPALMLTLAASMLMSPAAQMSILLPASMVMSPPQSIVPLPVPTVTDALLTPTVCFAFRPMSPVYA